MPFTVPLVELLDVVNVLVGHDSHLDARLGPVVVHHPRHGFDERALRSGGLSVAHMQPFTFDPAMLHAATVKRSTMLAADDATDASTTDASTTWLLPASPIDRVSLNDLVKAVSRPAEVYLRHRLDVRLPGETPELDDGLPVAVGSLQTAQLGRELLAAMASTAAPSGVVDVDELSAAVRLR